MPGPTIEARGPYSPTGPCGEKQTVMASRRDELNAYTFAKRRTVAAFLQPSATGTEEGAPRPLRAVVPGLIAAAVVLMRLRRLGHVQADGPQGLGGPRHPGHRRQGLHHPLRGPDDEGERQGPDPAAPGAQPRLRPTPAGPLEVQGHPGRRQGPRQGPAAPRAHHRHPVRPRPAARQGGRGQGQALGRLPAAGRQRARGADRHLRPRRPRDAPDGRSAQADRHAVAVRAERRNFRARSATWSTPRAPSTSSRRAPRPRAR